MSDYKKKAEAELLNYCAGLMIGKQVYTEEKTKGKFKWVDLV